MHPAIRTTPFILVSLVALASCSGLSDVGEQETLGPKAVLTVLGHPFTAASDGSATATVRAQTEVVLTAKDSVEGSAPISEFTFEQTDNNAKLPLVIRTRNTVAFAFPTVAIETQYVFKLTVTDSNGGTSSANASFTVAPVLDPNRFLSYLNSANTYQIVVAPTAPVAPSTVSTGEFQVTVKRLLTYTDRAGDQHTDIALDSPPASTASRAPAPVQVAGAWSTQLGASANCVPATAALENRQFNLDIPSIDQDDINLLTQSGNRSEQLELADIDDASLSLDISVAQSTAVGPVPQICVFRFGSDGAGTPTLIAGPATAVTLNIVDLRGDASESQDTRASATSYYESIGAATTKLTFFSWLRANGFDPSANNYGADAHSVYTNNFDLGFGRDMYMKVTCAGGSFNIGNCDVASVVVNYPSLENAAKKLNPINAVAMEYSGRLAGSPRFVKFYAYAPNPRDPNGDFSRIHSVNLDGRGEKHLPGSCTVCHSGTPGGLPGGAYGNEGDLNSAFLPWDLDSLLFSDTDTSFSGNPEDAALKATLTRSAQEAELRKLNAGAYLTFDDRAALGRFAIAQELIKGWYEEATLPVQNLGQVLGGNQNSGFVPPDWQPTAHGNPSDSVDVYKRVFAQNCRMCHAMHIPTESPVVGDPHRAEFCDRGQQSGDPSIGVLRQVPMACYWQFANAPNLALRLSEGTMPFARLTSDRLWALKGNDGRTAGTFLIEHLARADSIGQPVSVPGTPIADIELAPVQPQPSDIGTDMRLTVINSRFVNSVQWSVKRCTGSDVPASCTIDSPVTGGASSTATVRIAGTGEHLVELRLNGQSQPSVTDTFSVVDEPPALVNPLSVNPAFTLGLTFRVADLVTDYGNGGIAMARISVSIGSNFTVTPAACLAPLFCPASTDVRVGTNSVAAVDPTPFTVLVQDANDASPQSRTYTISATGDLTAQLVPLCTMANTVGVSQISPNCAGMLETFDILAFNGFGGRNDVRVELLTNNHRGVVQLTGTPARLVSYLPPPRFATHGPTGSSSPLPETFDEVSYQLVRVNGLGDVVERSDDQVVRFQIRARRSFETDFIGTFNANGCSGCHSATGGAPNFSNSGNPNDVYAILRNGNAGAFNKLTTIPDAPGVQGRPYVVLAPGSAESSGLYCWPRRTCNETGIVDAHFVINPDPELVDDVLRPILEWVEDGGNRF